MRRFESIANWIAVVFGILLVSLGISDYLFWSGL